MNAYCTHCNKNVLLREEQHSETYPVKGEEITIMAKVLICEECGTEVWTPENDDSNLEKAYEVYRKRHGLLMPHEIQSMREKYGVSQVAFARILGFGDKTIARYENGSIQDEAPNNLLLLVRNPDCFMELFQKNKGKLTEAEILQVESKRMTFTLPVAMKYSAALKKMGCLNQISKEWTPQGVFFVGEEEVAIS